MKYINTYLYADKQKSYQVKLKKNEVTLFDNTLSNFGFSLGVSKSYIYSSDVVT